MASLLVLFLLCLTATTTTTADDDNNLSAYEALATFNFPKGILPKGALGYKLNAKFGNFKAFLNGSCSFALERSYQLKYKPTISGVISKNKLTKLSGVSVKILFVWLNIVVVRRVDDELEFSVGIASANFPVNNFEECPQCGCGLNCGNLVANHQINKIDEQIKGVSII